MPQLLILGNQVTLYVGPLPDVDTHRHSASALCVGLSAPIHAKESADGAWKSYERLFVPSGVEHALRFGTQMVAVLFFEESSVMHRIFVDHYGLSKSSLGSPLIMGDEWLTGIDTSLACSSADGDEILRNLLACLLPQLACSAEIDRRVLQVIAFMYAELDRNFTAQELAEHIHLSPSRLSALFFQNMGMPLRRYRVWLRLRSIVGFLAQGMSLTEAAVTAGFADSAHFSNSCRKLLGIKPTDILANDGSLRILLSTTV